MYSYLASPTATRDVLSSWGLVTKKALGQHFLIDDNIIGEILATAQVNQNDVVCEVGPGIGTLTVALLKSARGVLAIERDRDMPQVLAQTCAQDSERFVLIEADAVVISQADLEKGSARLGQLPSMLVANLPYAVAATITLGFLERFSCIRSATVMVQREVASRMAAIPGTKDYGAYTVKLGMYAGIDHRFEVSRSCFLPPPHVDSSVIHLQRRAPVFNGQSTSSALVSAACLAADAAFAQRRKQIRNSLVGYLSSRGVSSATIDDALERAGIEPTVRGEVLDQQAYLALGNAFLELGICN